MNEALADCLRATGFNGHTVLDANTETDEWGQFAKERGAGRVVRLTGNRTSPRKLAWTWSAVGGRDRRPDDVVTLDVETLEDAVLPCAAVLGSGVDAVLDIATFYRSANPLRHFQAVFEILCPGGLAFVEGEVATDRGNELVASWYPATYENGDLNVRWVPTPACLLSMIEFAGLRVMESRLLSNDGRRGRMFVLAGSMSSYEECGHGD